MTDREMLELAAKAAGLIIQRCRLDDRMHRDFLMNGASPRNHGQKAYPWNPLTDDGDALRLAVRLRLDILYFMDEVEVRDNDIDPVHELFRDHDHDDVARATRRAITRAAAENGKQMGDGDV